MVPMPFARMSLLGVDAFLDTLDGLPKQLLLAVTVELETFGRTVTQIMQTQHTFMNVTGRLERSIGYTIETWRLGSIQVNVFALMQYASNVEEGTPTSRPYPFFWGPFFTYLPDLMTGLSAAIEETLGKAAGDRTALAGRRAIAQFRQAPSFGFGGRAL